MDKLKSFIKTPRGQIVFMIFCLAMIAWSIHGFIDMVHQSNVRGLAREFGAAVERLDKSPPGIERGETYLRDLKKIDAHYSPAEVRAALSDYINAFQQSLDDMKAGHETTNYDAAITDAKRRLVEGVRKYD